MNDSLKDHIFVIDSWLSTPEKEQAFISLVDRIKNYGIQIMLVTHYPASAEIQKRVDYYLFDKENPILIHEEFENYSVSSKKWCSFNGVTIENVYPFHHDYAIWQSMRWAFNFCKTIGKKYIHFLEYDCLPNYRQYEQCFIERIEHFDAIVLNFDSNKAYYTYLFSIKTETAVEIFNKIKSKFEYFTNKAEGFSLERVFGKTLNETTSNISLSDYLDNDNSLNTQASLTGDEMNRMGYILKESVGVDEDGNLYLIMSSGFRNKPADKDYLVEIRYKNKTQFQKLGIGCWLMIKLEKYQKNETLSVLIEGVEIRKENFNLDFEKYRELNKAILSNKKEKMPKITEIINESGSLGDAIAWIPIINEFAIQKNVKVNLYTPFKELFQKEYPLINFYDYSAKPNQLTKEDYVLACSDSFDWKTLNLQEIASKILGLPHKEVLPKITLPEEKETRFKKKYICIATQSTAQCKYWNNKKGWINTVNYLKSMGYDVVCIDKHYNFGIQNHMNEIPYNCINDTGEKSLNERISTILGCEFFVGLSSGLSWLAWACNKKCVMISGFTDAFHEFQSKYRVINKNVCNSCWHDSSIKFDASDWLWCPRKKNFECSKEISYEMVKEKIDMCIKDLSLES